LTPALWPGLAHAGDGFWSHEITESGVTVITKTEEGRELPIFRGEGIVVANLFEILAILDDNDRATEWMSKCVGARVLQHISEFERIEYNRTGAPWPVSDRDVVLRARITSNPSKRAITVRFHNTTHESKPPQSGVVRMPRLQGYYRLKMIDADHTRVTYEVDADPGGMLPDWLAKRTSRRLALDTILNLRRQVVRTRGHYESYRSRMDPARGGKFAAEFKM